MRRSVGVASRAGSGLAVPQSVAERAGARLGGVNPVAAAILTAMTGFVLLVAVMGSLGALLIHVLLPAGVQAWDERAVLWLAERRSTTWSNLSVVGSGMADKLTVVVLASLFLVVLSIKRMWRPAAVLVLSVVLELTVYIAATELIHRRRPAVHFPEDLRIDASFPSGHTAAAFTLYFSIALAVPFLTPRRSWRTLAWTLAAVAPVIVALARIYRGMHHPTDTIAGYLMGIGCVAVALFATSVGEVVARQPATPGETRQA